MKRTILISALAGLAGVGFAAVASASPVSSTVVLGKAHEINQSIAEKTKYRCHWVRKCWVGRWGYKHCRWVRRCHHW